MKNKLFRIATLAGIGLSVLVSSCGKKGCTDSAATNFDADAKKYDGSCVYDKFSISVSEVEINGSLYYKVQGDISQDYTFSADKEWLLSGGVFVKDGYTLTIEPGTKIWAADDGTVPFLSVEQGALIDASGTASAPIVFSTIKEITGTPGAGDWGGLILNGKAQINAGTTAEGEGGTGVYGGSDDSDNSGTLRYVRVQYAGKQLSTDNELNGISFNGVGSGTTVEYVEAYMGADDGFEFFGGTVNVKYAVSIGNGDDSFDWTHGWRGNGQHWVVQQSTNGGDRGMECDNLEKDMVASPYSNPTISNVTLVGAEDGDAENTGMRLRHGTKGQIYNAIVYNFAKNGIRVSDSVTTANMNAADLTVKSSISFGNGTNWKDCADFENLSSNTSNDPGLNGYLGVVTTNAYDPTALGSWFEDARYIGAVDPANDWTSGWVKGL